MTAPSETRILLYILAQLRQRYPSGIWERQNVLAAQAGNRFVRAGTPGQGDIKGIYKGRLVELEVKSAKGRQSKKQKAREAKITQAGGVYAVVRNLDDALAVVAAL